MNKLDWSCIILMFMSFVSAILKMLVTNYNGVLDFPEAFWLWSFSFCFVSMLWCGIVSELNNNYKEKQ
jgi:hypothetical protein